jgi:hypothetical protein
MCERAGAPDSPGPSLCPYSPECVEVEFSEVRIQKRAYPQPPVTLDLHHVALIPSDRPQHLALQNKDTSQRIQTE